MLANGFVYSFLQENRQDFSTIPKDNSLWLNFFLEIQPQ